MIASQPAGLSTVSMLEPNPLQPAHCQVVGIESAGPQGRPAMAWRAFLDGDAVCTHRSGRAPNRALLDRRAYRTNRYQTERTSAMLRVVICDVHYAIQEALANRISAADSRIVKGTTQRSLGERTPLPRQLLVSVMA